MNIFHCQNCWSFEANLRYKVPKLPPSGNTQLSRGMASSDWIFVFQGASKSFQSFMKSLAWGSGASSGWRWAHHSTCSTCHDEFWLFKLTLKTFLLKWLWCNNVTSDTFHLLWDHSCLHDCNYGSTWESSLMLLTSVSPGVQ